MLAFFFLTVVSLALAKSTPRDSSDSFCVASPFFFEHFMFPLTPSASSANSNVNVYNGNATVNWQVRENDFSSV